MGEMLLATERATGSLKRGPVVTKGNHGEAPTLSALGLTKKESAQAQRVGGLLAGIKERLPHGDWIPWIKANLPFDQKTAWNWMELYNRKDKLGMIPNLGITGALKLLAGPAKTYHDRERKNPVLHHQAYSGVRKGDFQRASYRGPLRSWLWRNPSTTFSTSWYCRGSFRQYHPATAASSAQWRGV